MSCRDLSPFAIPADKQRNIVVEIYDPRTNARIVKGYESEVFTDEGRKTLSEKVQKELADVQTEYDLKDLARYYLYVGENDRVEVFPTGSADIWLKYKNNIGVGAYLNRAVQEIYEPGSVMKPIVTPVTVTFLLALAACALLVWATSHWAQPPF